MATVVLVVFSIIVGFSWMAIERDREAQIAIGKVASIGVANQLAVRLDGLVRAVDLFARSHAKSLQVLAAGKAESVEQVLQSQLRLDFPEALRLSLHTEMRSQNAGHPEAQAAEVADFLSIRSGRDARELIWHRLPDKSHFDVLVSLGGEPAQRLVVSFATRALQEILRGGEPPGHRLMIVRRDLAGNAEVILTAQGAPGADLPSPRATPAGEAAVLGSRWQVVDVLEAGVLQARRNHQLRDAALLFLLVLSTLAVIAFLLSRQVGQLARRQQALADRNEQLQHLSLHDPLTGLPNRLLLDERLGQRVVEAARSGRRFALMVLDLDRFKQINSTFGRSLGDQLLSLMAERLRELLRDNDTVARIGDDDFALLVDVDSRQQAEVIAAKVLDRLGGPCELAGSQITLSANLGIALFPDHGRAGAELLKHAEIAMLRARVSGQRTALFQADDDPESPDRLSLLAGLRDAIREDQLFLEFQPKVECRTRNRSQAEVLVRWEHPVHGRLGPDRFLPLVEQTDSIEQLTHWVVEEALRTLLALVAERREATFAVNLSARVLHRDAFPLWVDRKLKEYGISAHRLSFEVTESAIMRDSSKALEVLLNLASIGCTISVDDFGTGYSSLAYLSRLPVSELKIDRSFVRGMMSYEGDRSIVRAIIDLAHDLSLKVVAEGVEDEGQKRALRELGCDLMQGHGISPPLNAQQLRQWLAAET